MTFSQERHIRPSPSLDSASAIRPSPLKVFERICIAEHYDYELQSARELHLSLPGLWCDHDVCISWDSDKEAISLFLLFEGRMPGGRSDDICRLMSLVNERLATGHFDFWSKDGALVYRNSLLLAGGAVLKTEQAMALLASALDAAERGYPACQYVVWAGKSPEEALQSALVDIAANP